MYMNTLYFHVDVNNAFLSWEAAYRIFMGEALDIRTIASVIAGDTKSRRGIILAKSAPAKKYGIVTGESLYSAKKKCQSLQVFASNYELYQKCSHALYRELYKYSNKIEAFSIDEYFVEIVDDKPVELAYKIKDSIYKNLGFTVNVGIAENKLLAKMASELKKPNMVHTLFKHEIETKMWPLDVGELFMVGRKTKRKLNDIGIYKIKDLATAETDTLKKLLGSNGIMIQKYANGCDLSKINIKHGSKEKSIGNSTTLKRDLYDIEEIKLYLLAISEMVGARIRNIKKVAFSISVNYKDSSMTRHRRQKKLTSPTSSTNKIYEVSLTLFQELWKKEGIRAVGISLNDLITDETQQLSLFDQKSTSYELDNTIDNIRKKYGNDIIKRASFIDNDVPHIIGGSGSVNNQLKLKSRL